MVENLSQIRSKIQQPMGFINGAEVKSVKPMEKTAQARHAIMNAALDTFVQSSDNCYLLDMRQIIRDTPEFEGNIGMSGSRFLAGTMSPKQQR